METTAFFERKVGLTPKEMNCIREKSIDDVLIGKLRIMLEEKCSEHGFILPGSLKIISRSMGGYEGARFTGEAVYFVKVEGKVLYPADGIKVVGEVIRKNKLGLYLVHRDALRIQIPRDLHLGNEEFDEVEIGDKVEVELKKSRFQINDPFILTNGIFVRRSGEAPEVATEAPEEAPEVATEAPEETSGEESEETSGEESEETSGEESEDDDAEADLNAEKDEMAAAK